MGATYTRQSTYADGDTINAADTNDEFDQLLAAFAASTGHTHDGTAGEGGPISTLSSNAISFGTGADTDIVITFNANTSDGVLTWMEDEDYFKFSDDILINSNEKVQFRDTGLYVYSSADGQLDVIADTEVEITAPTVDLTATTAITLQSDAITLGEAGDTDVVLTFNANTADGVLTWMEDEDYFQFSDDILMSTTEKIQFRDTAIYIYSSADGQLDLVADTEIQIAATTVDINGAADVSGTLTYGSLSDGSITITAFVDEDDMSSDSATLVPTQQSVKAYVDSQSTAMSFVLEDGDGTEVTISENKEVKFIEGGGIDIDWTDTDNGTDGDPYDLTFTINAAQTGITSLLATDIKIGEDDQTKIDFETADEIHFFANNVSLISLTNANSGDAVLTVPTADKNFTIKGTDGSSAVTALDIDMAAAGDATFNNKVIAAELDISGNVDVDGTLEADAMTLNGTSITTVATLSTGISNGNLAVFTSGAADNDFLRIDGTSIEGRSASEVVTDIGAATTGDATALAVALG